MIKLELKGYADKTGNAAYNQKLSERRVDSVADFLISNLKISPQRITKQYFGSKGVEMYRSKDLI